VAWVAESTFTVSPVAGMEGRFTKIDDPPPAGGVGAGTGATDAGYDGGEGMPTGSLAPGTGGAGGIGACGGADRVESGDKEGSVPFPFPKRRPRKDGFSLAAPPWVAEARAACCAEGSTTGGEGGMEVEGSG